MERDTVGDQIDSMSIFVGKHGIAYQIIYQPEAEEEANNRSLGLV